MSQFSRCAALGIAAVGCCYAGPLKTPQFDAASVRRVSKDAQPGFRGDPSRAFWSRAKMSELVKEAFAVDRADLEGPGWLDSEYYAITVTMPPTTTLPEFRLMMVQLLVERFHLAFHREMKEERGYELVVAQGGPKITPSPVGVPSGNPSQASSTSKQDGGGFPVLRNGLPWQLHRDGDVVRATFDCSMDAFANALSILLFNGRPAAVNAPQPFGRTAVTNNTGLRGNFSFRLEYASDPDSMPGALGAAIQSRLGLRLVERKVDRQHIVIDHLERVPIEE